MTSRKRPFMFPFLLGICIVGAGCDRGAIDSSQTRERRSPSAPQIQEQAATGTQTQAAQIQAGETADTPTTLTFDVTAGSFYFTPSVIRVKKGDTVKIVIRNTGGFHNFVLDEFNVKLDIPKNTDTTATTEFVADKTGSFEFYCGVGSHRQMGQKGTLIVEE